MSFENDSCCINMTGVEHVILESKPLVQVIAENLENVMIIGNKSVFLMDSIFTIFTIIGHSIKNATLKYRNPNNTDYDTLV